MPARLTRADAARIAALAKLDLTDAELDRAATELGAILGYFDVLGSVDIAHIDRTDVTQAASPLRADAPVPGLTPEEAFRNAPDADRGAGVFRVPRVLGS